MNPLELWNSFYPGWFKCSPTSLWTWVLILGGQVYFSVPHYLVLTLLCVKVSQEAWGLSVKSRQDTIYLFYSCDTSLPPKASQRGWPWQKSPLLPIPTYSFCLFKHSPTSHIYLYHPHFLTSPTLMSCSIYCLHLHAPFLPYLTLCFITLTMSVTHCCLFLHRLPPGMLWQERCWRDTGATCTSGTVSQGLW